MDHHLGGRVDDAVDRSGEHDGTRTEATAAVRDIRRDPPAAELLGDPVAGSDMPPGLSRTTSLMLGGMVLTIISKSLTMDP